MILNSLQKINGTHFNSTYPALVPGVVSEQTGKGEEAEERCREAEDRKSVA